ncbi:BatD family protein [Rickettsiales bacterium]|nr:BatD family protein [Rickettsiales bacterium]
MYIRLKNFLQILCLLISIIFPKTLIAAEIFVSTDRNEIFKNESINVEIVVKDTKLKSNIDYTKIEKFFTITKKMRRSSHTMIQNKASRSEIFQLQLKPKQTGEIIFPSISVKTSNGILSSNAFRINVQDTIGTSEKNKKIAKIEATLDQDKIYFGEYTFLKLKIYLYENIINAQITIPELESATIEKIFTVPVYKHTINGKKTEITELIYKIKPILEQDIKIGAIILTGEIKKDSEEQNNFFQKNNIFFSYNIDNFEEISITSNKINTIKVLNLEDANIASTSFTNKIEVSNITTDINSPLNLSITFETINNSAEMLPDIELQNNDLADFYQEKTLTNEEYDPLKNQIVATKIQNYTIIPKKAGDLTIDQVLIPWFNKNNNKIENLSLQEINFKITNPNHIDYSASKSDKKEIQLLETEEPQKTPFSFQENKVLIYLIIVISILFVYSLFLTLKLFNFKIISFNNNKKIKYNLKNTESHDDMRLFLFQFFSQKFKKNIENFDDIKLIIKNQKLTNEIITDLLNVIKKLELSLYGNQIYDFNFLKDELKIKIKYIK